jgi:hypothetical protein
MSEWGNPAGVISCHLLAEFIGQRRRTGGIETSQYPQEQKSNEILLVAASERGIAQTVELTFGGVVGPAIWDDAVLAELSGKSGHRG